MRKAGFHISYKEVITALYATASYLREVKPKSCWVMLEREGLNEFKEFKQDTENPEYIVIGDRISIDIKGAKNLGIKSMLLKTGEFGEFNEKDLYSNIKPDFIFDSIKDILKIF